MPIGPITEVLQRQSGTQVLDWKDALYTVEATDTPFLVLLPEGKKPVQVEGNWPASKIDVGPIVPVADGKPVADEDFRHQNRKPLKGVTQEIRAPWKVSPKAQLTETWGVKDETNYQKSQGLLRLRLMLERLFLSKQDCAREGTGGATADALRAVGRWLEPLAASLNAEFPIPEEFRVPAACKYTGTLAAFTDTTFEGMLKAACEQRKRMVDLDLQASTGLQKAMSDWTQHDPNVTANNAALVNYNMDANKMAYIKKVEFFTFHSGYVRSHANFNMFYDLTTGLPTATTLLGGYGLDMTNGWEIRFMQQIMNKSLPDDGSGERGFWVAMVMLCCMMPAGQLLIEPSA